MIAIEKLVAPLRGGEFLLKSVEPLSIFTPEDFTSEDLLFAKTATDFLNREIMPHVEQLERGDHELMSRLIRKAGEVGLLGSDIPEVYGGLGTSQMVAALIAEKINPQQSFALTHEVQTVIAGLPILYFGNHEQKSRVLPKLASGEWIGAFALSEAGSGSDSLAMQTHGTLSPGDTHYILNGTKMWITNSAFADLFTVFAKVDNKVAVFLVERNFPGVSFGNEEHKLGMHGTSTRRVIFDNVPVPTENVLGIGKGHYAAFCALNMGRFMLEAGAVGGLKYLLNQCATYTSQRKTFGKPIAEHGMVQHKLAEMAAQTFGLESMIYRLAGDLDGAFSPIDPTSPDASDKYHRASEEFAIECSIVKVIGSELYSFMADESIQIHGGNGYTEEFPFARAWRDQRLLRIGEGANEIVRGVIVNTLLRRDRAGRLLLSEMSLLQASKHGSKKDNVSQIIAAANQAKVLAVSSLLQAVDRLGSDFAEMQEIGAAIADMVCATYGLESIGLRLAKMAKGSIKYAAAELCAQIAALEYESILFKSARYLSDNLRIEVNAEERLRFDETPLRLRRALATIVVARSGYPI